MSTFDEGRTASLQFHLKILSTIDGNNARLGQQIILFTGELPYSKEDLIGLVTDFHICDDDDEIRSKGEFDYVDEDIFDGPNLVVVGSKNFDEDLIKSLVNKYETRIKYIPQEAFLDLILFGHDWYDSPERLLSVAKYHCGLQFLRSLESFVWPTTRAAETSAQGGSDYELNPESILHQLGYQITGMKRKVRWRVLTEKALPKLGLEHVANYIAWLARERKAQRGGREKYRHAISEWEHDLNRLKAEYYDSNSRAFRWPSYSERVVGQQQASKESSNPTRGWLGVRSQEMTAELAQSHGIGETRGVLVMDVFRGSPAEVGEIKRGDVIVTYDGKKIERFSSLAALVAATPVGKVLPVEVIRDGEIKTLNVTVAGLAEQIAPDDPIPYNGSGTQTIEVPPTDTLQEKPQEVLRPDGTRPCPHCGVSLRKDRYERHIRERCPKIRIAKWRAFISKDIPPLKRRKTGLVSGRSLLLNRRGIPNLLKCRVCGEVPAIPGSDVCKDCS